MYNTNDPPLQKRQAGIYVGQDSRRTNRRLCAETFRFFPRRTQRMFGNPGAFSLSEAPVMSIEESGSDNVPTLLMRFPRRTQLPAPQKCSPVKWGSGGTWLLKDQGASRGSFSKATSPGDFLVPFASLQKELAAAAAKSLFCYRGCSACGRATFQRRKVTASSQSPLCSGHPGLGIPHAAPLLLLSNHEPLRWVHGWGPIAGLRARTQESCAVSLAIPAGAETS